MDNQKKKIENNNIYLLFHSTIFNLDTQICFEPILIFYFGYDWWVSHNMDIEMYRFYNLS